MVVVAVGGPIAGLLAAMLYWNRSGLDAVQHLLFLLFYSLSGFGITVGFHRLFTHGSFRTGRSMKIMLAICGSMAFQGPVTQWVATHRRHHQCSDGEGDPHL